MKNLSRHSGFSIIEVMVVLVIIGIIVSMVAPDYIQGQADAQVKAAATEIIRIEGVMEMYKLRTNRFPTTEQGLEALVTKPTIDPIPRNYPENGFIKRLSSDPWGNPYTLISPGEMGVYDIFSNGPDMEPGTDDDIGTWNVGEIINPTEEN